MKKFKKFLGVFLALAMVVGVVGMMPTVEAKAVTASKANFELVVLNSDEEDISGEDIVTATGLDEIAIDYATVLNHVVDLDVNNNYNVLSIDVIADNGTATVANFTESDYIISENKDEITIKMSTVQGYFGAIVSTGVDFTITVTVELNESGESGENTPPATGEISNYLFNPKTNILTISVKDADTDKDLNDKIAYIQVGEMKYGKTDLPKKYNTFEVKLTSAAANNVGTVDFDLSAYAKKDIQLHIRTGESDTGKFVSIAKSKMKLKVVLNLDADDAYDRFTITNGPTALTTDEKNLLQYRVEGSSWVDFKNDEQSNKDLEVAISKIEQFGSTIYFRILGPETEAATGYTFASPEAKAKYPKLGKAPGITLDYVKNIVKFAKEVEVIGILADPLATTPASSVASDWKPFVPAATKAESVSLDKLVPAAVVDDSFTFYVQTAAKDRKPKSAVTMIEVKAKEPKDTITAASVAVTKDEKSDKTIKGITIENKTGKDIEYLITGDATPAPEARWTKITTKSAKKSVSGTTETLNGKNLFVRYPGVKENTRNDISAQRTSNFETFVIDATKAVEAPVAPGSLTFEGALTDVTGAETDGKATLTYNETVAADHKFVYKVFDTSTEVEAIKLDDVATGWTALPVSATAITLGDNAADVNGKILVVAEVLIADSKIKKIKSITISGVADETN